MALIFSAVAPGPHEHGTGHRTDPHTDTQGATMGGLGVRWTLHGDGKTPAPGAVVRPDERLSWPRTFGLGAQHVVAMFGASFVAPVLMGLDPNLAIMMSGVATAIFLLATRGRVPSYLGCSLSFVGVAATIRAGGGDSAVVTGAVFVVGVALFLAGLAVQRFGARIIHAAMPPVVTGAVVMLIGFNLAPVTASTYWPQDQWTALLVMLFTGMAVVCLRGFFSRIAIFLGLVFGYVLSWVLDRVRQDPFTGRRRRGGRPLAARPVGCLQGRLDRTAVLPRPELRMVGDPGRAAGGDRADRGERGARQGRGRDDG